MSYLQRSFSAVTRPLIELAGAPRAIWCIIAAFGIDSIAYFGMLNLMTVYLGRDLGWGDEWASTTVSLFTMLITLAILAIGSSAESLGLRRAILLGLILAAFGRELYCYAPFASGGFATILCIVAGLLIVAASNGVLQPICYSGIKQYTNERTSSMGYAAIYAFSNLGIIVAGGLSAWIRPGVNELHSHPAMSETASPVIRAMSEISLTGVQAVNWLCSVISVLGLVLLFFLFTRRAEASRLRPEITLSETNLPRIPWRKRLRNYFTEGPFSNKRFLFFIFMLLPVRTLFAHQFLTMPEYILRAYPKDVSDKMEWLLDWVNPGIIFLFVPLLTAITRRINVYKLMMYGSLVSALPTFLLCFGPHFEWLLTYFILFSIGEALWTARFFEYSSELAPPGRIAQYMGLANIPWLLAKGTTGWYSGFLLKNLCPKNTPVEELHTGTLWFIYGCIAMLSPIGLWLGRKWFMSGQHPHGNLHSH